MAIFKKDEPQPQKSQKPRERLAPPSRNVSGEAAISIIGEGMTVIGDIETEGIVRIEGEVRGTVNAGKAVILGQAGTVDGDISTDDAVIGGRVNGSIATRNRLELQSSCTVEGEIRAPAEHLKLEEGARFAGQVVMSNHEGNESPATQGAAPRAANQPSPPQSQQRSRSASPTTANRAPTSTPATNGSAKAAEQQQESSNSSAPANSASNRLEPNSVTESEKPTQDGDSDETKKADDAAASAKS